MLDAWSDLSSERQIGMNLGPIPYTTMVWYAGRKGLEGDAVEDFCALLAAMDAAWLKKKYDDGRPKSPGPLNRSRKSK